MGNRTAENPKLTDSLSKTGVMSVTTNTNQGFFEIDKQGFASRSKLLFFPNSFYEDSIITKIVYHLYRLDIITNEQYKFANEKTKKILQDTELKTSLFYKSLINDFKFRKDYDKTFGFYLPIVPQGSGYDIFPLRREVYELIEKKYGSPIKVDTVGDQHNVNDLSFYINSIWETDLMKISLLTRRLPGYNPDVLLAGTFYHVLIYEYNDKTRKKYKMEMNKSKDLSNTF